MATIINNLSGVTIRSPYFSTNPTMEFFPYEKKLKRNKRAAVMFGPNGSGKSTIAKGFREYVDTVNPRSVEIELTSGDDILSLSPDARPKKIFIFDETYIDRSVKIRSSGLDAIVLFGEQVQLEQQIQTIDDELKQQRLLLQRQEEINKKYTDPKDDASPQFWISTITKLLKTPGGWSETLGMKINGRKTNAPVTEAEIDRIGKLTPQRSEAAIKKEFEQAFSVFSSISADSKAINGKIKTISIQNDLEENTENMLARVLSRPELTARETELLDLFGVKLIEEARSFLIDPVNKVCPLCLQPVSEDYREDMISRIEGILNREVQEYRQSLQELLLPEISEASYDAYRGIDEHLHSQVIDCIRNANSSISVHNRFVQAKYDDPFEPLTYDHSIGLRAMFNALNAALSKLESARQSYNDVVDHRRTAKVALQRLLDDLASYQITETYASLCRQRTAQQNGIKTYRRLDSRISELERERTRLDSLRKNFQIAVDQINQSLEYIFYAKGRLVLELGEDQFYHLRSRGQAVKPEQISCGERNALALSYFFTEVARNTDARNLYKEEVLLVIDDPVSSFDMENRIGILSFLRFKLNQILTGCSTTKLLVMTHDIRVLLDLDKALKEILEKNDHSLFRLQNKQLVEFLDGRQGKYNEYTALVQQVYAYAKSPDPSQDLVIGNMMRRVLEAFSSFSYKIGITEISTNSDVLALLPNEADRMYFQNSMYRLVLHGESHFEEAVRAAPEATFFSSLSDMEKQRTARDILCFIYLLNKLHLLKHLPNGAQADLDAWLINIQSTFAAS